MRGARGAFSGRSGFPLTARWRWESFVLVFRAFLFSKTLHGPRGNTSLLGLRSRTESCGLSLPLKSRGNRRRQGLDVLRPPRESWAPFWARSRPSFIRPLHTRFRARDDQGPFQAQSCDGDHRNQSPSSRREHAPTAPPVRLKYVSHQILLRLVLSERPPRAPPAPRSAEPRSGADGSPGHRGPRLVPLGVSHLLRGRVPRSPALRVRRGARRPPLSFVALNSPQPLAVPSLNSF